VSAADAIFPQLIELSWHEAYVLEMGVWSTSSLPRLRALGVAGYAGLEFQTNFAFASSKQLEIVEFVNGSMMPTTNADLTCSPFIAFDAQLVPHDFSTLRLSQNFPAHLRLYLALSFDTAHPYRVSDVEECLSTILKALKHKSSPRHPELRTIALPPSLQSSRIVDSKLKKTVRDLLDYCDGSSIKVLWDAKPDPLRESIVSPTLWDYAKKLRRAKDREELEKAVKA
jgi:hypothetical protein